MPTDEGGCPSDDEIAYLLAAAERRLPLNTKGRRTGGWSRRPRILRIRLDSLTVSRDNWATR